MGKVVELEKWISKKPKKVKKKNGGKFSVSCLKSKSLIIDFTGLTREKGAKSKCPVCSRPFILHSKYICPKCLTNLPANTINSIEHDAQLYKVKIGLLVKLFTFSLLDEGKITPGYRSKESVNIIRKAVPQNFMLSKKDLVANYRKGEKEYNQVIAESLAAENLKAHNFTLSNSTLVKRLAVIQPEIPRKYLLEAVEAMRTNIKQSLEHEAKILIGDIKEDEFDDDYDEFE